MSEAIYVTKTVFKGVEFEVGFLERNHDALMGYIQGPKKRVEFKWRPGQYKDRPWIAGANYKDINVVGWVKGILHQTAENAISEHHTGGDGVSSMGHISLLIKKGHVRNACWVKRDGNPHAILRRATIVNPRKMSNEEHTKAQEYVAFINFLVRDSGVEPMDHDDMRKLFGR